MVLLWLFNILKTVYLHRLKGMQNVKGVPFVNRRCTKGWTSGKAYPLKNKTKQKKPLCSVPLGGQYIYIWKVYMCICVYVYVYMCIYVIPFLAILRWIFNRGFFRRYSKRYCFGLLRNSSNGLLLFWIPSNMSSWYPLKTDSKWSVGLLIIAI